MLILRGHEGPVRCLAYSPDGRLLASGSDDKTVKIWHLSKGREQHTLYRHKDWVRAVAFASDGKTFACGSWDEVVFLWSVELEQMKFKRDPLMHQRERRSLRDFGGGVWSLAFSHEGQCLAVGCTDGSVFQYWKRDIIRPLRVLNAHHPWPVNAVTFSPDGSLLAAGGHDRTVRLWDAEWGRETAVLTGHADWVRCLAFSPDGRTLVSGSEDSAIKFWDVACGEEKAALRGHTASVRQIAFAPDGRTLISASWDETVRVWDVTTGCQRTAFDWKIGRVHCVALAPDGMTAAAGGHDGSVVVWDVE
jgi:COMPASS component SWD3